MAAGCGTHWASRGCASQGRDNRRRDNAIGDYQRIGGAGGECELKSELLGRLFRSMLNDKVASIHDRNRPQVVAQINDQDALGLRCAAIAVANLKRAGR